MDQLHRCSGRAGGGLIRAQERWGRDVMLHRDKRKGNGRLRHRSERVTARRGKADESLKQSAALIFKVQHLLLVYSEVAGPDQIL